MFSRTSQVFAIPQANVRGMATLKEIRLRLKSVKNIQKITKSMKMVSAAKYAKAEKDLKPARPYGEGAEAFFTKVEADTDETKPNHLIVAFTSDRGLCGGVHSSVCKAIRAKQANKTSVAETKFVLIGDKSKQLLQKFFAKDIIMSFNNIGKKPPNFRDATFLVEQLLQMDYKYGFGKLFFNKFKSVVSYKTTELQLFPEDSVRGAKRFYDYDSLDDEVVRSYQEFMLTSRLYYALKEGACSEQSSRMTAMDSASKNAQEMISKLTLTFNRTRQSVITRELIEIISGAAAL